MARFPVPGLTSERALVLGEVYRREGRWRLRAVGQGWDGGLSGLATDYGVTIDQSGPVEGGELTESAEVEHLEMHEMADVVPPDAVGSVDDALEELAVPAVAPAEPVRRARKVRVAVEKPVRLPPIRLAEDPGWQSSRLFSISGIGGADEQEKRPPRPCFGRWRRSGRSGGP